MFYQCPHVSVRIAAELLSQENRKIHQYEKNKTKQKINHSISYHNSSYYGDECIAVG